MFDIAVLNVHKKSQGVDKSRNEKCELYSFFLSFSSGLSDFHEISPFYFVCLVIRIVHAKFPLFGVK